jgi:DNA modification methylase
MHQTEITRTKGEVTLEQTSYQEFMQRKVKTVAASGFDVDPDKVNAKLFKFQRDIVRWACKLGKAAIFAECGLGKTAMQLEWAHQVAAKTGGKVLVLAPLAVADQTVREGAKFGIDLRYVADGASVVDTDAVVISNYDRLHLFDPRQFVGVVLDESSILKNFTGKTKRAIFEAFKATPYKLACTATPAPNDQLELGNHAAFLNVMEANEMISRWFINDTMEAGNYRLKKHAAKDFWRWLTSWAVCLSRPGDLGAEYEMAGFDLPPLNIRETTLTASAATIARSWEEGRLIPDDKPSSTGLHKVKRESLSQRIEAVKGIVDGIAADEPILIWCDTDYEADALKVAFPEAVEIRGSHKHEVKAAGLLGFADGKHRILITKPEIAGFGLNFQNCSQQILAGVSFSFERFYQAVRRSYRFGQTRPVDVHLVYAETEGNVVQVLKTKQQLFREMQEGMNEAMNEYGLFREDGARGLTAPQSNVAKGKDWTLYLGDCVEQIKQIEDNSIDFGVHSPPFANLYIYSDSAADMGNSTDDEEFFQHYKFLISELLRTTRPGRLCAVHCKDLPTYMNRDGAAGLKDFPGEIIKAFEAARTEAQPDAYWQYHSRVTIWKDPVIEMQRTKNHGLLHKNFAGASENCRQGMPDYLVVFRKHPTEGGVPVKQVRKPGDYIGTEGPQDKDFKGWARGEEASYSIAVWQRYASPVWFDIDQTNVLNYQMAKDTEDEKHICPLQLDVIERSIQLWTNPGETVLTPFAGIGSEVYSAVKLGRKGIGIELKESYWRHAQRFLQQAELEANQEDLFSWAEKQKVS